MESLCKSSKTIILYDDERSNQQWISDGIGIYLLDGLPPIDPDIALTLFDVAEDKRGKFHTAQEMLPRDVFNDSYFGEREIYPTMMHLEWAGENMVPFVWNDGIEFVRNEHFNPLGPVQQISFHLRDTPEGRFIAIKSGMFLVAMIRCAFVPTEDFAKVLMRIAVSTDRKMKQPMVDKIMDQMMIDRDTGEVLEDEED